MMNTKTAEAAVGRWPGILAALGVSQQHLVNRHGPCPLCEGKDRFRFDDKDGRGTWYCNQCGAGDGMDLAMRYLEQPFATVAAMVDQVVGTVDPVEQRKPGDARKRIERVARACRLDTGVIEEYLRRRGITDWPRHLIKLAPMQPYYVQGVEMGRFDAMVARLQDVHGRTMSLHLTYLRDGAKAAVEAPRKVLPPLCPTPGCAIRLSDVHPHLGIAEGIETALAVTRDTGLPCWAAANATLLEAWQPPEGVERVTVYGDADESYTGQAAAYALAKRLARSMAVAVELPPLGTDWADR